MVGREFKIIEFIVAKFSDTLLKFSKGVSLFLGPATKCAIHGNAVSAIYWPK